MRCLIIRKFATTSDQIGPINKKVKIMEDPAGSCLECLKYSLVEILLEFGFGCYCEPPQVARKVLICIKNQKFRRLITQASTPMVRKGYQNQLLIWE